MTSNSQSDVPVYLGGVITEDITSCIQVWGVETIRRTYSRNLGQRSILARKGNFFEKRASEISPTPHSIPFLSVLHQNNALHNFRKRGQRLIVKRNIGLEYALIRVTSLKHDHEEAGDRIFYY